MSLKITGWKKILSRASWVLVIGVMAGFIGRVAIWEHFYYEGKEGSERAKAMTIADQTQPVEELEEEKPTETEVYEYIVKDGYPRYISVPDLGVFNTRIIEVGLKPGTREVGVPSNIYDVGWFNGSNRPGEGGAILLDGHSGGPNQLGIFRNLPSLSIGGLIQIEVGGGKIYTYKVVENVTKSIVESNKYMSTVMRNTIDGKETITIISCTGEWSQSQYTYLSRQFVRAVLVK